MEKQPEKKQPLYRGRAKSERNSGTELKAKYTFLDKDKQTRKDYREDYISKVKNIGIGSNKKAGEVTATRLADKINPGKFYLDKIKPRAGLPAKNTIKMVYDSEGKRSKLVIPASTGKWKKVSNFTEDQGIRQWSELTNGIRWYYRFKSQQYYFEIEDEYALPEDAIDYSNLSAETLSKEDWKVKGLKVPTAIPYDKEAFLDAVQSGLRRFHTMSKGVRSLSNEEQNSRKEKYHNLYIGDPTENYNGGSLISNLKYAHEKLEKNNSKDGRYTDHFDFVSKEIFADQTYAYEGLNGMEFDEEWFEFKNAKFASEILKRSLSLKQEQKVVNALEREFTKAESMAKSIAENLERSVNDKDVVSPPQLKIRLKEIQGIVQTLNKILPKIGQGNNVIDTLKGELGEFESMAKKLELSLSEILYQQMLLVKEKNTHFKGKSTHFDTYKSGHIAGPDGMRIVEAIRSISRSSNNDELEFTPADQGFYALLGIPNGSAAVWLVNDHGDELGIDGIEKVVLTSGNSLKVYFKKKHQVS